MRRFDIPRRHYQVKSIQSERSINTRKTIFLTFIDRFKFYSDCTVNFF